MSTTVSCEYLIVGAGITGLALAARLGRRADYWIVERESEPGGYCRTVEREGFVWDYSGHFFHFRHPEIERYLVERMRGQRVQRVQRRSKCYWKGALLDFPFQMNIHQLPREDFLACLLDLYFKDEAFGRDREPRTFKEMLYARFGRSIAEMFLVPYNEKLYAVDLDRLDVDAMGRFFPYADFDSVMRHMRQAREVGYNATFTYPEGGAIQYVHALLREVEPSRLSLGERLVSIDLHRKEARTERRTFRFEYLVSTMPLPRLLEACGVAFDRTVFTANKVAVFNLGFDRKGWRDVHWIYFPQRDLVFYRVGFYDNIFDTERMSLYVEVGVAPQEDCGPRRMDELRARVLRDLRRCGIVRDQRLVAWHQVLLDPAYVHIHRDSEHYKRQWMRTLAHRGVHSIGRYGGWTYCSIEDNIVEAWALADSFLRLRAPAGVAS